MNLRKEAMKKVVIGATAVTAAFLGVAACSAPEEEEAPQQETSQQETETSPPEEPEPQEETDTAPPEEPEPQEETDTAPPEEGTPNNFDGLFTYEVVDAQEQSTYVDYMDTEHSPDEDSFFVVQVTATNKSDQPETAPDPWMLDDILGVDTQGQSHLPDDEPWTANTVANPGSSVRYSIVWDLPEDVDLENMELSAYEADDVALVEIP